MSFELTELQMLPQNSGEDCESGACLSLHSPGCREDSLSTCRLGKNAALSLSASKPDIGPQSKRSEEHTSELQSHLNLVCRLLLEKKTPHVHRLSATTQQYCTNSH